MLAYASGNKDPPAYLALEPFVKPAVTASVSRPPLTYGSASSPAGVTSGSEKMLSISAEPAYARHSFEVRYLGQSVHS